MPEVAILGLANFGSLWHLRKKKIVIIQNRLIFWSIFLLNKISYKSSIFAKISHAFSKYKFYISCEIGSGCDVNKQHFEHSGTPAWLA